MARIYCDSTHDKKSKVAFLGYCSEDFLISKVLKRRTNDINGAELAALKLAISDLGLENNTFYSDSQFAVDTLRLPNVYHVKREFNLADIVVQSYKERAHVCKN